MSVSLGLATETEGRGASQGRLLEGGRYLGTPQNRASVPAHIGRPATTRLMVSCSPSPRWPIIHLKPSPIFVSHFRGSVQ